MGNYAALMLDASKIEGAVKAFPGCSKVVGPTERGKFLEYEIHTEPGITCALLHVFARGDTTTTLHYKVGKNQGLSAEVAEHVATTTAMVKHDAKPLSLKNISPEQWTFLLESLAEEKLTLTRQIHQNAERYAVLASGLDEVFIHRFTTGRFLMQGRPYNAYGKVVDCLSYVSDEKKELIAAQLETIDVKNISSEGLLAELEQRMPAACNFLNDTVKCIFAPALALTKLSIDLPDYSALTYPALRGLEGSIKEIFLQNRVVVDRKKGIGEHFNAKGLLRLGSSSAMTQPTVGALESFYDIYNKHRNSLFHTDQNTITSRIIETKAEAIGIVDDVFYAVEKGFSTIP